MAGPLDRAGCSSPSFSAYSIMQSDDEELDLSSSKFNPERALYSDNVKIPYPDIESFETVERYEEAVKREQQRNRKPGESTHLKSSYSPPARRSRNKNNADEYKSRADLSGPALNDNLIIQEDDALDFSFKSKQSFHSDAKLPHPHVRSFETVQSYKEAAERRSQYKPKTNDSIHASNTSPISKSNIESRSQECQNKAGSSSASSYGDVIIQEDEEKIDSVNPPLPSNVALPYPYVKSYGAVQSEEVDKQQPVQKLHEAVDCFISKCRSETNYAQEYKRSEKVSNARHSKRPQNASSESSKKPHFSSTKVSERSFTALSKNSEKSHGSGVDRPQNASSKSSEKPHFSSTKVSERSFTALSKNSEKSHGSGVDRPHSSSSRSSEKSYGSSADRPHSSSSRSLKKSHGSGADRPHSSSSRSFEKSHGSGADRPHSSSSRSFEKSHGSGADRPHSSSSRSYDKSYGSGVDRPHSSSSRSYDKHKESSRNERSLSHRSKPFSDEISTYSSSRQQERLCDSFRSSEKSSPERACHTPASSQEKKFARSSGNDRRSPLYSSDSQQNRSYSEQCRLKDTKQSDVMEPPRELLPEGVDYGEGGSTAEKARGRTSKKRNVFTRMAEMEGPLHLLTRCVQEKLHVRVLTREAVKVRSICRGYIVAFDKYFNMAMIDVDEIYRRPKQDRVKARISKKLLAAQKTLQAEKDHLAKQRQKQKSVSEEITEAGSCLKSLSLLPNDPRTAFSAMFKQQAEKLASSSNTLSHQADFIALEPQHFSSSSTRKSSASRFWSSAESTAGKQLEKISAIQSKQQNIPSVYNDTEAPVFPYEREALMLGIPEENLQCRHVNQMLIRGENVVSVNIIHNFC